MKEINTILIANRGEIASRIIRTCKHMGINTVAVYSDIDKYSPYVAEADKAIHIGANDPQSSYLNMDMLIEVAKTSGSDAIHPGYGFLSENADFAAKCRKENIIFIGPSTEAIERMGSKSEAKNIMFKAGVPIIPGYNGEDQSPDRLMKESVAIGFPVLLKASAGGGGKGMRVVNNAAEIELAVKQAKNESLNAFGDDRLIIEKYIENSRHIEVQVFGDQHGNHLHLFERECTIQRRYQKIIEESPSPALSDEQRHNICSDALKAAKAINYDNAGTVEFIFNDQDGSYFFLEMNTRLQVEHPVTEAVTGLDLVQMQIEVAMGKPLNLQQEDIRQDGYAIEVRLYAEDPSSNFAPQSGTIHHLEFDDSNVRFDCSVSSGSEVSIYYDPMIGKIIASGADRAIAHKKLRYFLQNLKCLGIKTNGRYLHDILNNSEFKKGNYNINFVDNFDYESFSSSNFIKASIAASIFGYKKRKLNQGLLKSIPLGWRNIYYKDQTETYVYNEEEMHINYRLFDECVTFNIQEKTFEVSVLRKNNSDFQLEINGVSEWYTIFQFNDHFFVNNVNFGNISIIKKQRFPEQIREETKGNYQAHIPSKIVDVLVKPKDQIKVGDPLLIISSMKMENTILANENGMVQDIYVGKGDTVDSGTVLIKIKEDL
ncbi:MAG: ATP-grasp domain-containing protein [Flavobacteriales bacterium]|nr:ATP-grasp domain-containing protein [Flavobacteriales bacterium]